MWKSRKTRMLEDKVARLQKKVAEQAALLQTPIPPMRFDTTRPVVKLTNQRIVARPSMNRYEDLDMQMKHHERRMESAEGAMLEELMYSINRLVTVTRHPCSEGTEIIMTVGVVDLGEKDHG